MRTVKLPSGATMPVLGQGTWRMGEKPSRREEEVAALRFGLDLGINLIDTAEMYGEGGAEEVISQAIKGRREEVFLVSKVYPYNASRQGAIAACERSLQRLKTDYLDLYLLHWPGSVPIAETLSTFQSLRETGKIREYGVSNFNRQALAEAEKLDNGFLATNQVFYNLQKRNIEWNLLPWCRSHHLPVMAYSPLNQGRLLRDPKLKQLSQKKGITPAQFALAWLLQQEQVVAIPKSSKPQRLQENYSALDVNFSEEELAAIDRAFPPPTSPSPLEII